MISMNNTFRIFTLAVATFVATALCAQTYWGYAQESTCSYRQGKRFNAGTEQGFAIKITKEKAQLLKGHKITGLRAMFATTKGENIKAFVTSTLDSNDYEFDVASSSPRFTDYNFDQPYTITGDREFYAGFTLDYSSNATNIFSVDWTSELPAGLVWAYTGSEWKNVECNGAPAIYLILDGRPDDTDLMVKPIKLAPFYTAGKTYDFTGQIINLGTQTITSMDLGFKTGDNNMTTRHLDGLNIQPQTIHDFTLNDCKVDNSGILPINVAVSNINGTKDADMTDNTTKADKYIYPNDVKRRVFLETFTGLDCLNCPAGSATIKEAIAGQEDRFVIVAHHTYGGLYGNDVFSMKEDNEYKWLFNGQQYAPAVTANRVPYADGLSTPIVQANAAPYVKSVIYAADNRPPYIDINLNTSFDATTRLLTATVDVTTYEMPPYTSNKLNVFLKQDSVFGKQYPQAGAGENYVHNYIFRGSLTGTWGEDIELKPGETITKKYTYTLPDSIMSTYSNPANHKLFADVKQMHVVAFVEGVTDSQVDCPIYNVAEAPLAGSLTGIETIGTDNNTPLLRVTRGSVHAIGNVNSIYAYNMQGALIDKGYQSLFLHPGAYILRIVKADGHVVTQKTIIK